MLLSGGGSGGPTIPLIALAEHLQKRLKPSPEILFLGSRLGPERAMVEGAGIEFEAINSGKLRRYWDRRNITDVFRILHGAWEGAGWLRSFRPDVMVSAGSFVSVPVSWATRLAGIPQVLLQMDVRPGLANRLMAPNAEALAHYPETPKGFNCIKKHIRIGPVVKEEMRQASAEAGFKRFDLDPTLPLLLITGGGQGAKGLNDACKPWIELWTETHQVLHLIGSGHPPISSNPRYYAFEFVREGMADLLAAADMVISRSGMGIVGELSVLGKDVLLVPLPESHQQENARWISEGGGALELSQQKLASEGGAWWKCWLKTRKSGILGERLYDFFPPAGTEAFASLVLRCAHWTK